MTFNYPYCLLSTQMGFILLASLDQMSVAVTVLCLLMSLMLTQTVKL